MNVKKGPWTQIDSREIYKNPWIQVVEDKVIRPDGQPGIFGLVHIKPGATVLPVDEEGNVYLVQQYRYTLEATTIESISGGIDGEEAPLQAAKRELLEEAGIVAQEWTSLGMIHPFTTIVNSPGYLFLAKKLSFEKSHPEGTEDLKIIKAPFSLVWEWVSEGKICDAISTILIFKAKDHI